MVVTNVKQIHFMNCTLDVLNGRTWTDLAFFATYDDEVLETVMETRVPDEEGNLAKFRLDGRVKDFILTQVF